MARRIASEKKLALELSVNERTIRRDIVILMTEYPLISKMGRNGGVQIADWYHPHRNILTKNQRKVLIELAKTASEMQRRVLYEILSEYGAFPPEVVAWLKEE